MKLPSSANGLFRATGKKAKPTAVRLLDGSYTKVDQLTREKDEFYATREPEPVRAFLWAEREHLRRFPNVWEMAAGDGAMVRELERGGLTVLKSDLVDRGCGAVISSFYDFDVPLSPAGAAGLAEFWSAFPPAVVSGQGSPPMLNAWFVWDTARKGETVLRMLDRHRDIAQEELL